MKPDPAAMSIAAADAYVVAAEALADAGAAFLVAYVMQPVNVRAELAAASNLETALAAFEATKAAQK